MIENIDKPASAPAHGLVVTRLGIDTVPPIGLHEADGGDVYFDMDGGAEVIACCETCGHRWSVGFIAVVRELREQG